MEWPSELSLRGILDEIETGLSYQQVASICVAACGAISGRGEVLEPCLPASGPFLRKQYPDEGIGDPLRQVEGGTRFGIKGGHCLNIMDVADRDIAEARAEVDRPFQRFPNASSE
jgi:hypothetical protein